MRFFLPKTDPDVCKYQPDIIRGEGPDFAFHNFDVFTSAEPDLNNKERENKEIHIYPALHNLDQIRDFFYCGVGIGGSSRLQFFFNYLKLLDKGMAFWVVIHKEYRKPPFFWRRPWIEISSVNHSSCDFNANVTIPYSIKSLTRHII